MKKFLVISRPLDRVTHRVSEVEDGAFAGLVAFVSGDNRRFDLNIALNQRW